MAGADFFTVFTVFTVEVFTWRGQVTYNALFFLHLESRRVCVAGITRHPDQAWIEQIVRSATQPEWGYVYSGRRWRRSDCPSSQESQSECLCRTLGSHGERRMPVEFDSL